MLSTFLCGLQEENEHQEQKMFTFTIKQIKKCSAVFET